MHLSKLVIAIAKKICLLLSRFLIKLSFYCMGKILNLIMYLFGEAIEMDPLI